MLQAVGGLPADAMGPASVRRGQHRVRARLLHVPKSAPAPSCWPLLTSLASTGPDASVPFWPFVSPSVIATIRPSIVGEIVAGSNMRFRFHGVMRPKLS